MRWRMAKIVNGKNYMVDGENVFDCKWIDTGQKVSLHDPYNARRDFKIYDIIVNGVTRRYAVCPFGSSSTVFYIGID